MEGTEEKESRGDAHPAASDLQFPKEYESNLKNKLEGLCDLGSRAATGISSNRLKWEFISGHFTQVLRFFIALPQIWLQLMLN